MLTNCHKGVMAGLGALMLIVCCGCDRQARAVATPPAEHQAASELKIKEAVVVIDRAASETVRFAAKEMSEVLGKTFGAKVEIVNQPDANRTSIVLGENVWTKAAGIDVASLARDEFVVCVKDGSVYIAGRDAPEKGALKERRERATLFGVYEFLYRYAGVRFYFPGDLGTIVPRKDVVSVPVGHWSLKPDYSVRRYGFADGTVAKDLMVSTGFAKESDFKDFARLRLRMETYYLNCCHGQFWSNFYRRFHETHPEYFRMDADGKRCPSEGLVPPLWPKEHLCQTSAVWEEIYQDAKAYLTGNIAARKIPRVKGPNQKPGDYGVGGGSEGCFYDVMPHDGLNGETTRCRCPSCMARYDFSRANLATDLIWSNTVAVANRLIAEKVPGYVVQMAYFPYKEIPDYDIPTNVLVMVAEGGPWHMDKYELKGVAKQQTEGPEERTSPRAWAKKLGRKVWTWTYPAKVNAMGPRFKDIPQMTPKAWGRYYKSIADFAFGGFAESESDRWFYNHLNYYVFSRVCWNTKTDVAAELDEYYRLMYGAAAPQIRKIFDSLEERWLNGICRRTVETPLGPQFRLPPTRELWEKVYTEKVLNRYLELMRQAEAAVALGSPEARRLALVRTEMIAPLVERATKERNDPNVK